MEMSKRARQSFVSMDSEIKNCRSEIKKTLGFVPKCMESISEAGMVGNWAETRDLYFNPTTDLPMKLKDLISIAVDVQVPSEKAMYMDTELARRDGVSLEEYREAVNIAALVRHWSIFLNGIQMDEGVFSMEVRQILEHLDRNMPEISKISSVARPFDTRDEVYMDIDQTFGLVPEYLRKFPAKAIGGAWASIKYVLFNPNTALSMKAKQLIGLAVAAQIPCRYCTFFHTEGARFHGATEREINETLAISALGRFGTVMAHGAGMSNEEFRDEVQELMHAMGKRRAA